MLCNSSLSLLLFVKRCILDVYGGPGSASVCSLESAAGNFINSLESVIGAVSVNRETVQMLMHLSGSTTYVMLQEDHCIRCLVCIFLSFNKTYLFSLLEIDRQV